MELAGGKPGRAADVSNFPEQSIHGLPLRHAGGFNFSSPDLGNRIRDSGRGRRPLAFLGGRNLSVLCIMINDMNS